MSRRTPILALLVLFALLAGVAKGELSQEGNLRIAFKGDLTPKALPRDRPAPVSVALEGSISTTDGTQPPALQRLKVSLNRNGRISSQGLPRCTNQRLQSTSTEEALERCRPALVGRGHFGAAVSFPSLIPFPTEGTMLAFNGRANGRPALLLHLYGTVPTRIAFVLPMLISNPAQGRYGTVLSARIPTLAGGGGAISEIDLKIGRTYSYRGKRRSFISASCAAPAGFPGATFAFARGDFRFSDGRQLVAKLLRSCQVR